MFDWLGKGSSVDQMIAKRQFGKAVGLLRAELERSPNSARLLQKLADVLILDDKAAAAVAIFHRLVDSFAGAGYYAKAIAVAKKIERLDPGNVVVQQQLRTLVQSREGEEATARAIRATKIKPVQAIATVSLGGAEAQPEAPTADLETDVDDDIIIEVEDEAEHGSTFRESPLFQGMTDDEVCAVIDGLHLRTFEPGEIVVTESEPGASMFLLASGIVRVFVRSAAGLNAQLRVMGQGDFFGEISLLTGSPRTATITAATPCELLELTRDDLVAIASRQPQVASIIESFCLHRAGSPEESQARRR